MSGQQCLVEAGGRGELGPKQAQLTAPSALQMTGQGVTETQSEKERETHVRAVPGRQCPCPLVKDVLIRVLESVPTRLLLPPLGERKSGCGEKGDTSCPPYIGQKPYDQPEEVGLSGTRSGKFLSGALSALAQEASPASCFHPPPVSSPEFHTSRLPPPRLCCTVLSRDVVPVGVLRPQSHVPFAPIPFIFSFTLSWSGPLGLFLSFVER